MIIFNLMPGAYLDDLGLIPHFFRDSDPRPAKAQVHERYAHGGGWRPIEGFELLSNGDLHYMLTEEDEDTEDEPDPPVKLLATANFHGETINIYEHGWVAIIQANGSFEVSRLD